MAVRSLASRRTSYASYDQRRAPYDHPDFNNSALSEDLFCASLPPMLPAGAVRPEKFASGLKEGIFFAFFAFSPFRLFH